MSNMSKIAGVEIALVSNPEVRNALYEAYEQASDATAVIESFFDEFTARAWNETARCIFFKNWRSPGTGAASFCALTFRLLGTAEQTESATHRDVLYRCATRLSEVSHEDVGIGGVDHQQLYDDFANRLAGTDAWKLDRYAIHGLKEVIPASRRYRQNGEDLGRAMLISLPEELYNHAEFTFAASRFSRWHRDVLKRPDDTWKQDLAFIHDHLGETERGHFASLVQGFDDFCSATEFVPDWSLLRQSSIDLLNDMARYYRKLSNHLHDAEAGRLASPRQPEFA
ncbi:hypothetical protein [Burkholderia lata]|uniref:Uncharacterized protein n=1 Tax=Burkholderia lata (strain ATCC 17760 / DSM 23089 / LMG 22485 / NCIMB 9086 / R18194 / 383) TaxID=482957 RepID=A0A6P2TIN2_BURL3|nr:hypothetical protein [Burkholderia lata]VWC57813.1 hypothetical protein BLA18109_01083 [Burkholderia lata]